MVKIFRMVIYAVIIAVIYIAIMTLLENFKSTGDNSAVIENENQVSLTTVDTTVIDAISVEDETASIANAVDYEELDKKLEKITGNPSNEKSNPKTQVAPEKVQVQKIPKPIQSEQTSFRNDGNLYMVMAGSYLLQENADKMVDKLKKYGFLDAKKAVFSESQYYSVIAVSCSSNTKAQEAAGILKRKGIDSFVKAK